MQRSEKNGWELGGRRGEERSAKEIRRREMENVGREVGNRQEKGKRGG